MLTKLFLIFFGIIAITNSISLIAAIHYYKKYKALKNDYAICTDNLKKVTNDYNNLLNEYSISIKKYRENLTKLNKRTQEIKTVIDKYKEINVSDSLIDNECEQLKAILDKFVEIDKEVRTKLGEQK